MVELKNNSFGSIRKVWDRIGLKEWKSPKDPGHYILWKKPPDCWPNSWVQPEIYDNVISWYTGSVIQFLGMGQGGKGRGGTDLYHRIDEYATIDVAKYKSKYFPRLSAEKTPYLGADFKEYWHLLHSLWMFTSAPEDAVGSSIYDYDDLQRAFPETYYFDEGDIYDNIHYVGADYIEQQRQAAEPQVWSREFMSERMAVIKGGWYIKLGEQNRYQDNLDKTDPYYDSEAPISYDPDYQSGFECALASQDFEEVDVKGRRSFGTAFINQFYGDDYDLAEDVVDMFCDEYEKHSNKIIHLGGDASGLNPKSKDDNTCNYDDVAQRFRDRGWQVVKKIKKAKNPAHEKKYKLVNKLLPNTDPKLPKVFVHELKCADLLTALALTKRKNNYEKDKRNERSDLNKHLQTHLTDCLDYKIYRTWRKYAKQKRSASGSGGGGVL